MASRIDTSLNKDSVTGTVEGKYGNGTVCFAAGERVSLLLGLLKEIDFNLYNLAGADENAVLTEPVIFIADFNGWQRHHASINNFIRSSHYEPTLIFVDNGEWHKVDHPNPNHLLNAEFSRQQLAVAIRESIRTAKIRMELERLRGFLDSGHGDLQKMIDVGISLSSERSINRLLDKILLESCKITCADAGSIYIMDKNEKDEKFLRFSNTRCHSLDLDFKEFTIPLNMDSIAGYVAMTGESLILDDCYNIPEQYAFSINRSFDENNNYRTKSMLAVAMHNQKDEITGVIQLINRKKDFEFFLSSPEVAEKHVFPFDERNRDLIDALASQAAVALENNQLYNEIERLFEGFVHASVTAIESRDPTTSGHSERVALLTTGIAETVNKVRTGPLREMHFNESQLKEIRYASLLHDFGKVGVREHVLLKAKKLFPWHLELIRKRFEIVRKIYREETSKSKIEYLIGKGREEYLDSFAEADEDLRNKIELLDNYLNLIVSANEPTVLKESNFDRLEEIARTLIKDAESDEFPLLYPEEKKILTIPKGSLTGTERNEIESHVTHTYNFLTKIPWTGELKGIPEIAYGHHEKLDGTGYPLGKSAPEIKPQTRMMTISDIFDALAAQDRPYKPALSVERALDILNEEARGGKIDPAYLNLFIEGKVFERTAGWISTSKHN